ncbi:uncharacterized protein F4807DRAFT_47299 [Annulohypoxylon truncatum]|uniref:uncharacterized protein n=1 Tax=Annulohypoxylon truncatum TaxID=327061 RepID=UPI0020087C1D|nr:uncharacterized protein F4807DRAFT_47299 [Annulohypoxylon truncatum]KAI1211016.1 hypothetical protein F4807DRAFT_47299 [Annulohypoxylon truncatum]
MSEVPVIQILDKKNYFKQALVAYPNALPLPPLAESSLRIRTEVISITTNNFCYCKLGDVFNWWSVHPIPPDTPAPYSDAATYGRINAWGYARVLESTFAAVPTGSYVWGYLPIGTLPLDFRVAPGAVPGQFLVTEPYRQQLLPVYNRYTFFPAPSAAALADRIAAKDDGVAYDALVKVMHLTAYLMDRFMYPADSARSVSLRPEQADLSNATVVVFAPGSKVGLAFAHLLRQRQKGAGKPRRVVGAASEASLPFVRGTGVYDTVVSTTAADPLTTLADLDSTNADVNAESKDKKVVIYDFGGRAGVAWKWAAAIGAKYPRTRYVAVGIEVSDPTTAGDAAQQPAKPDGLEVDQVNADGMLTAAVGQVGEKEFFEGFEKSWSGFREEGIKGFQIRWGEGIESVKEGWDRFARNEVTAAEGLVFKL